MRRKKLSFSVHSEDIRPVATNVISLILARFGRNYSSSTASLNESTKSGDNVEILEKLQELVDTFEETIKEIEMCADLIESVEPLEKEEESEEPKKKISQE
tara:strand:+ start:306 stop:608 length:303 start_codon:yes stop_codon:yes gene_type:complete